MGWNLYQCSLLGSLTSSLCSWVNTLMTSLITFLIELYQVRVRRRQCETGSSLLSTKFQKLEVSSGSIMIALNWTYFKTYQGIIKVSEWVDMTIWHDNPVSNVTLLQVLTLVLILILSVAGVRDAGNAGIHLIIGTSVGCCLITSSTIIAHVLGDKVSLMELTSDGLSVLFLFVTGILEVSGSASADMVATGILSLLTSVLFLVDLVMLVKSTKFSFQSPA